MSFRDDLGNLCFYEVNVQMASIASPSVPEFTAMQNAQRVFGQYGIGIRFASGKSLLLNKQQQKQLLNIDTDCSWDKASKEQQLLDKIKVQSLHDTYLSRPFDIRVFFVNEIHLPDKKNKLNGCGGHASGRPAVLVASTGTPWTLAHELGHVLLGSAFSPVHSSDSSNVMFSPTSSITQNPPTLNAEQLIAIKASKYCLLPKEDLPSPFWQLPKGKAIR